MSGPLSLILKYVARASVAVPFVIALGFALAAVAAMLVDRFGHIAGYWLMAAGLAAIGVTAAIFVSAREQKEEVADQEAEAADTSNVATQVATQAPLAVLGGLLTLPGGATTAFKVAQLLGRNYPLVLLAALIGLLFWPTPEDDEETTIVASTQRLGRSFAQSIPALDRQRRGNQSPPSENDGGSVTEPLERTLLLLAFQHPQRTNRKRQSTGDGQARVRPFFHGAYDIG